MKDNDLVEVEIKHGDDKILLKRSQPQQTVVPMMPHGMVMAPAAGESAPACAGSGEAAAVDDGLVVIESPMVGTFYAKPSPDSELFVDVDSHISEQSVICIIEAMKVMNEIKAETSGTVVELLATNGQAVEYGQPLFKVRPD